MEKTNESPDSCFVKTTEKPGSKKFTHELIVLHGYAGRILHKELAISTCNGAKNIEDA